MQVRLKKAWGHWSKGHVFPDMPGGQARTLIARGLAEEVRSDGEAKAMASPMNRMMRSPKTKALATRAAI